MRISAEKCREKNNVTVRVSTGADFERNTEYKSKTLDFVGLYWDWVEVFVSGLSWSICIISPIIYNLLSSWMYPVLKNYINLLIYILFVFAFGAVYIIGSLVDTR